MEEIRVTATRVAIEEFLESSLWKDIKRELETWKTAFSDEMNAIVDNAADSNPTTAQVLMHLGDLNGRRKAVDYFLTLPSVFLQFLEDNKDDTEHNPAD